MNSNSSAPSDRPTTGEIEEFERRAAPKPQRLDDPIWRLCNLYSILSKGDGRDVMFRPHDEQRWMMICIYLRGWLRIINPKARQRGMSTLLALIALDGVVFRSGYHVALIDKNAEDAAKKHREKVLYAWERLPPTIRDRLTAKALTDKLTVRGSKEGSPESTFTAAINFRGGTVEMLWISEWGTIQDDDRARSREIKAGAMPALELAEKGLCVIETTWKGGLDGELGQYVTEALDTPEDQKGPKSWRIVFIPWWSCEDYTRDYGHVDPLSAQYFRECEARGLVLTEGQKRWYAEKRRTASSAKSMKEEYPSFAEECWENSPVGSIYGKWIEEARVTGRISNFLPPRDYPVHTFADIGHPLNTVQLGVQMTPHQIRFVDVLMEVDMTIEQRAAWWRQTGWDMGNHYFPWDADSDKDSIGVSPMSTFRRVFGPTCRIVPRCHSVWDGISAMRTNFSRCVFVCDMNAKADDFSTPGARMKQFIDFLGRFRADRETSTGVAVDKPVHDRYSHCASAFAQLGLTIAGGAVEFANSVGSRQAATPRRLTVITAGSNY